MKTLKTKASDLRNLSFAVEHGTRDLKCGILHYRPDFDVFLESKGFNLQRNFCWTLNQKRKLIETFLLKRSMPPIVFNQRNEPNTDEDYIEIIDGKQRLSSVIDFMNDKFTIILESNEWFYSELPLDYQRLILKYPIDVLYAFDLTDDQKIQWFTLVNFTGTLQDEKHLEKLKS